MQATYYIERYTDAAMTRANCVRLSERKLPWRKAVKIVYWLRKRGVMAFAF